MLSGESHQVVGSCPRLPADRESERGRLAARSPEPRITEPGAIVLRVVARLQPASRQTEPSAP
jgi:hypothetical protein